MKKLQINFNLIGTPTKTFNSEEELNKFLESAEYKEIEKKSIDALNEENADGFVYEIKSVYE